MPYKVQNRDKIVAHWSYSGDSFSNKWFSDNIFLNWFISLNCDKKNSVLKTLWVNLSDILCFRLPYLCILRLTMLLNIHEDTACACRETRMLGTCCNTWWKGGWQTTWHKGHNAKQVTCYLQYKYLQLCSIRCHNLKK